MVELGLHTESESTFGRVFDYLVAALKTAEGELDRAPAADKKAAGEKVDTAKEAIRGSFASPDAFLSKIDKQGRFDSTDNAYSLVFTEVLARWKSGLSKSDREQFEKDSASINDISAAANLNRRSLLAVTCTELLPEHLMWTRLNADNFRKARMLSME